MSCQSETHWEEWRQSTRMDLHCWNRENCPSFHNRMPNQYFPHMGVLIKEHRPWICNLYHLPFLDKNDCYVLRGDYINSESVFSFSKHTSLSVFVDNTLQELLTVNFIPLPTGDDGYDAAWKLFTRLKNLSIFA
jgi:hypothetical protein